MAEWVWSEVRRCWDSADRSIYRTRDGGFVIADDGGWLPGVYDSPAAAELAFARNVAFLQALQERKTERPRAGAASSPWRT